MINEVREAGVDVQAILVTHGHGDHLAGYNEITGSIGAPAAIGEPTTLTCRPARRNGCSTTATPWSSAIATIRCIGTPGHTDGSTCYQMGRFPVFGRHPVSRRAGALAQPRSPSAATQQHQRQAADLARRHLRVSGARAR